MWTKISNCLKCLCQPIFYFVIQKSTSKKELLWTKFWFEENNFLWFLKEQLARAFRVCSACRNNGRTQICDWLSQTEEMKMEMPQLSVFSRFLFLTLGTVFLFSVFLRKSGNYSMLDKWNQLFTFYLLKPIIYPINKLFSTYWIKQKAKAHFKWQCLVPE